MVIPISAITYFSSELLKKQNPTDSPVQTGISCVGLGIINGTAYAALYHPLKQILNQPPKSFPDKVKSLLAEKGLSAFYQNFHETNQKMIVKGFASGALCFGGKIAYDYFKQPSKS